MKICVLDGHTMNPGDLSWDDFSRLGSLTVYDRMTPSDVIGLAGDAEVILTNKVAIGKDMMDMLTRLKYIGVLATGYNVVDTEYARQLDLPVTNIPGYSRDSVAQTVFSYMLHLSNNVADYNQSVKNGDWETSRDFSYLRTVPVELAGKTLGIVGYGDIGSKLAAIARSFGMEVITARKPDGTAPASAAADIASSLTVAVDIEELFSRADFISLHIPLSPSTQGMVNARLLAKAREGSVLINTARGQVVDEAAILDALDEGRLSWYASDVYAQEPPRPGSALIHHPRTIFTPHIAWASREARSRALKIACSNIEAWMKGSPANVVNSVSRGR